MSLQAVILAGGEGKRSHPLGITKPKSMFELMGKPLIQYVIENLRTAGITDLIIVTGPNQEKIHEHFGDGSAFNVKIQYTFQPEPLGQANAVQTAESLIHKHFFVLNANDIFNPNLLTQVIDAATTSNADIALVGTPIDDPTRFGVMRFNDDGKLIGVLEKPPAELAPSKTAVMGIYYFSPDLFDCIRNTPLGDTDDQYERAYQLLIDRGNAIHIEYNDIFESFKFPWNLLSINDLLLAQHVKGQHISPTATISDRAIIGDNVIISDNVRIFENAVIRGPAYIGPGSIVGNNTMILGGCTIGAGCVIGFGSEIKHAVFGNNVWTHRNYVGDSIIADNCSFGAGTITANYRFNEKDVWVNVEGSRISTGTDKFGVIMGEGCRTGSNSVIMPGTKVGPNSIVGPGVILTNDLPANKFAILQKNSYRVRPNEDSLTKSSRDELKQKMLNKT